MLTGTSGANRFGVFVNFNTNTAEEIREEGRRERRREERRQKEAAAAAKAKREKIEALRRLNTEIARVEAKLAEISHDIAAEEEAEREYRDYRSSVLGGLYDDREYHEARLRDLQDEHPHARRTEVGTDFSYEVDVSTFNGTVTRTVDSATAELPDEEEILTRGQLCRAGRPWWREVTGKRSDRVSIDKVDHPPKSHRNGVDRHSRRREYWIRTRRATRAQVGVS